MKYLTDWNAFKENGSFNGNLFEDLVKELLACMYPNVIWEQTKKSWDGNKDFVSKGLHSNEKWAECKCYKKKLDLKVLAPTLVMSTVSNIKDILIFSYSEINTNAKRKIAQFAESQEATIKVYENEVLEALVLKYQDDLNIEIYFPCFKKYTYTDLALQNQLSFMNSRIMKEQSWRELKKERLRINDIIKITVTVCNSSLESVNCSLEIKKYEKNMAMLTPSKTGSVLKGGEIRCYYFHMQINHYDNLIKMPEVYLNKMKILSAFSITCDWLLETPLIGYINECEKITNVLNSSQNNILVIHGRSGVGKSRLLKEYYHKMKSMYPHTFLMTPDLDASLCNWIKLLIANLYDLPIIDIAFAETQIIDNGSLLTNILYNSKFQFTVHKNEIIRLLLSKIASISKKQPVYIFFDDLQNFDDITLEWLQSIIKYLREDNIRLHLMLSLNDDLLITEAVNAFYAYLQDQKSDYVYLLPLSGFKNGEGKIFIDHCFNILDTGECLQNEYKEIILRATNETPLYIEHFLIAMIQMGVLSNYNGSLIINNTVEFLKQINNIQYSLNSYLTILWNNILLNVQSHTDKLQYAIKIILFIPCSNKQMLKSCGIDTESIQLLLDVGIIMESNSHVLHFQHAIIENFLKESLDPLSEKEMKILYQYLNKYLDYKHLPYRFLLAYSLRKITQEDVDLILSLLEEIADPKLLFRVTHTLMECVFQNFKVPFKVVIMVFNKMIMNSARFKSIVEVNDYYEKMYDIVTQTAERKNNGDIYYQFLNSYLNKLLELHDSNRIIEITDKEIGNISGYIFTSDNARQHYLSRIFNRRHIALNRLSSFDNGMPYNSEAKICLEKSLSIACACNDIDMMIQNEIDYGNLFNRDPKYKNKICFHWDNAYAIYENNKNTVFFWNVGVLFYEAYSELLHPNPSVDRIGSLLKECFSAYQENLNSYFFYLKARILKSIVELIYMPDKINLEYLKQTYQYVQRYTNKGMLLTISHIYAYLNQNRRNAEGNWHQAFHYLMQLCDGQGLEKNKHIALIAEFSYQIIKTGHLLSEDEVDFLPSELKLLVKSRKNDRQWKTLRSKGLLYSYADDIFYPYI